MFFCTFDIVWPLLGDTKAAAYSESKVKATVQERTRSKRHIFLFPSMIIWLNDFLSTYGLRRWHAWLLGQMCFLAHSCWDRLGWLALVARGSGKAEWGKTSRQNSFVLGLYNMMDRAWYESIQWQFCAARRHDDQIYIYTRSPFTKIESPTTGWTIACFCTPTCQREPVQELTNVL